MVKRGFIILAVVTVFWCILPGFIYLWITCHPHREPVVLSPHAYGLEFEDVTLKTGDDLSIAGWFLPAKESSNREGEAGLLFVHGYGENRDSMLDQAAYLHYRYGYSILLIDIRGHGKSSNYFYTYGITEARDTNAGLLFLKQHLGGQALTGTWGFSAGTSAIINSMNSQNMMLDFMILESPPLLDQIDLSLPVIFTELMTGMNLRKSSCRTIFKNIKIPILAVAGEREHEYVENIRWMERHFNNSLSRAVIIPQAGHGGCWSARFKIELNQFLMDLRIASESV